LPGTARLIVYFCLRAIGPLVELPNQLRLLHDLCLYVLRVVVEAASDNVNFSHQFFARLASAGASCNCTAPCIAHKRQRCGQTLLRLSGSLHSLQPGAQGRRVCGLEIKKASLRAGVRPL